jgi:hypothetical protein
MWAPAASLQAASAESRKAANAREKKFKKVEFCSNFLQLLLWAFPKR